MKQYLKPINKKYPRGWVAAAIGTNIADVVLTYNLVQVGAEEKNPLINCCMTLLGNLECLTAVKSVGLIVLFGGSYFIDKKIDEEGRAKYRLSRNIAKLTTVAAGAVALWGAYLNYNYYFPNGL